MTDRERMIEELTTSMSARYGLIADACADEGRLAEEQAWRWLAKHLPHPAPLNGYDLPGRPSMRASKEFMESMELRDRVFGPLIRDGFDHDDGTPYRWRRKRWPSELSWFNEFPGSGLTMPPDFTPKTEILPDDLYDVMRSRAPITAMKYDPAYTLSYPTYTDAMNALYDAIASGLWTPPEGSY